VLLQIFLDALGLSQQVRRVLLGQLDKSLQCLHRQFKLLCEFLMLLVLPSVSQPVKRAWSRISLFSKSVLNRCSSSANRRTFSGSMIACDIFSLFVGFSYAPPDWRLARKNLPQPPSADNHSEFICCTRAGRWPQRSRQISLRENS